MNGFRAANTSVSGTRLVQWEKLASLSKCAGLRDTQEKPLSKKKKKRDFSITPATASSVTSCFVVENTASSWQHRGSDWAQSVRGWVEICHIAPVSEPVRFFWFSSVNRYHHLRSCRHRRRACGYFCTSSLYRTVFHLWLEGAPHVIKTGSFEA